MDEQNTTTIKKRRGRPPLTEQEKLEKIDHKTYMRDYMKERYHADIGKARAYKNSMVAKARFDLTTDDFKEYGIHLANIHKLRKLKDKIPRDLWDKCLATL